MIARGEGGTVVLALHYQNDVLHPDGRIALGIAGRPELRVRVLSAAGVLLGGARAAGVPLVHVRIAFRPDYADAPRHIPIFAAVAEAGAMAEGSWGSEFHEGCEPRDGEHVVTHDRISAFYGSELGAMLETLGARHLLLAGIASNSVVEHTARDAADRGFAVTCVADACASARDDLHAAAMANIALIGQTTTADAIAWADWKEDAMP